MREIVLEVVSSPGCTHCAMFEEFWHSIEKEWSNVTYKNVSIVTPEGQALAAKHLILASPGIIIDGELHATGGFNKEKFLVALKERSA